MMRETKIRNPQRELLPRGEIRCREAEAEPCPYSCADECAMAAERDVAGTPDSIPGCAEHGRENLSGTMIEVQR